MRYISTRGAAPDLGFGEVLLTGLARDGGLYIPESWPRFSAEAIEGLAGLSYSQLAHRIVRPFVGDAISEAELAALLEKAYAGFGHGQRVTIVGATSGDTGSAAIEACRDRERVEIFILHPKGRISEVQRRQMTTATSANVHNIAIEGSFDDCQDLVKAMFNDQAFRDEMALSAVNSINWARILGQVVYYFAAAVALGAPARALAFAVPTGNFGNVYAGYAARRMGLPLSQLVVGSNRNDILTRFLEGGVMAMAPVEPSLSPSMDIQVSSNFERLLFDLLGQDGAKVAATLTGFRETGRFALGADAMAELRQLFDGARLDDAETLAEIARLERETGELVDPHSAIGVAVARAKLRDPAVPMVALATAHPAKFPDAVERACGLRPALPPRLADLYERPERYETLPNDLTAVQAAIRKASVLEGAA
jgi:threonine synthase